MALLNSTIKASPMTKVNPMIKINPMIKKIAVAVAIVAIFTIMLMTVEMPTSEVNKISKLSFWPQNSYIVCTKGDKVIFKGFSKSKVRLDQLAGTFTFISKGKLAKITLKADCQLTTPEGTLKKIG